MSVVVVPTKEFLEDLLRRMEETRIQKNTEIQLEQKRQMLVREKHWQERLEKLKRTRSNDVKIKTLERKQRQDVERFHQSFREQQKKQTALFEAEKQAIRHDLEVLESSNREKKLSEKRQKLLAVTVSRGLTVQKIEQALLQSHEKLHHDATVIQTLKKDLSDASNQLREGKKIVQRNLKQLKNLDAKKAAFFNGSGSFKLKLGSQTLTLKLKELDEKHMALLKSNRLSEESNAGHSERVRRCELGMDQMRLTMHNEKKSHLELCGQYELQSNKLKAIQSALNKCKSEKMQDIVNHIQNRYRKMQEISKKKMARLKNVISKQNTYHGRLEQERVKSEQREQHLQHSRVQLNHQLQKYRVHAEHSFEKLEHCRDAGRRASTMVEHLEAKIHTLMSEIANPRESERRANLMPVKIISKTGLTKSLQQLQMQCKKLGVENKRIKSVLKSFRETGTSESSNIIEEMNVVHAEMVEEHRETLEKLSQAEESAGKYEKQFARCRGTVKTLELKRSALQKQLDQKGIGIGTKKLRQVQLQLEEVIRDKNRVKGLFKKLLDKHAKLARKMEVMKTTVEDLQVMKEKYALEVSSLSEMALDSAVMGNKLRDSKSMTVKKDQQLKLLAGQLKIMIKKVSALEKTESHLIKQLEFSSSPEDMSRVRDRLSKCQLNGKTTHVRYAQIKKVTDALREQLSAEKIKVKSFIDALKTQENTEEKLIASRKARENLKKSMLECSNHKIALEKDMTARIQAVERQYKHNLVEHDRTMKIANAKIQRLQEFLSRHGEKPNNSNRQLVKKKTPPAVVKSTTHKNEKILRNIKRKLVEAKVPDATTDDLIRQVVSLDLQPLNTVRRQLRAASNYQEKKLMSARSQTYSDYNQTLKSHFKNGQPGGNVNLEKALREDERHGSQREQKDMTDMLKWRAVTSKMDFENRRIQSEKWNLLQKADQASKARIAALAQTKKIQELQRALDSHLQLSKAKYAHVENTQIEAVEKLKQQSRYINQMKNQLLPEMQRTSDELGEVQIPQFRQQLDQGRQVVSGSLPEETFRHKELDRRLNANERLLKAVIQDRNELSELVRTSIRNPTAESVAAVVRASQSDESRILQHNRTRDALQDTKLTRVNFVVHPGSTPGRKGPLRVDTDINKIQQGRHQAFGDSVGPRSEYGKMLNSTVNRVDRAAMDGKDTIVVTYGSIFKDSDEKEQIYRGAVFKRAIDKILPGLQRRAKNTSVNVRFVQINYKGERLDLIGNTKLPSDCEYSTCQSEIKTVHNVSSTDDIMKEIKIPMIKAGTTHLVLSLSGIGTSTTVHIADVLNSSHSDSEVKLLDVYWTSYLKNILQTGRAHIDLYFNMFATDNESSKKINAENLKLSARISDFLTEYKTSVRNITR
jgi:hypothetical protein